MKRVLAVATCLVVACAADPVGTGQDGGVLESGRIVAPGQLHVIGHDRIMGTYHDHTAVEIVDGAGGAITVLQLWGSPGPDASGIALAVDEEEGWAEIHSNRLGDAPVLPLIIFPELVALGHTEPHAQLDVAGGVRLQPDGPRPECTDGRRGTL